MNCKNKTVVRRSTCQQPFKNHETQQTRQEERLRLQEGCEIHAVGEEESDQGTQQINTHRLQEAVEEMMYNIEMQNKTFDRRCIEKSTLCIVC
jgi:hypothetical protein